MKTRAWDGERWRNDYIIMPDGTLHILEWKQYGFIKYPYYTKVNWKLSRFTGLYDKNIREIYEDDIVGCGVEVHSCGGTMQYYRNCVIFWNKYECAWNIKFRGEYLNSGKHEQPVNIYTASQYYTVVGDIFTTPELVEVK